MKKAEITKRAELIAKANSALWDAIGLIESVVNDELLSEIIKDSDSNKKVLKTLALIYRDLDKNDEEFIDAGIHGRSLDDFDFLASKITAMIDDQ